MELSTPRRVGALLAVGTAILLAAPATFAVPSFARQTGQQCASCHITGFSTLTSFGRQFKLRGYALGNAGIPLSAGGVASVTSNATSPSGTPFEFKDDGRLVLQRLSGYLAGKIGDNAGAFVNWNYDGVAHRGAMEMVDLRYANSTTLVGKDLLYGVTLNNNPTVSDIFNSTPAFGFPQISPSDRTAVAPNAMLQADMGLASQVAGVTAYGWWNDLVYAEVGAYRTADKIFSILRAGVPRTGMDAAAAIKPGAPYWRLAMERQWNAHSFSVGTFGLVVDRYPDPANPTGPTDRFSDLGFDAQYQYLTEDHRISTGLTTIREKRTWRASFDPTGMASMTDGAAGDVTSWRAYGAYVWRKTYGTTLAYFSTRGSQDFMLYNTGASITGSVTGRPDTAGTITELSYIPQQNVRLALRYTAYSKFNGARRDYDGFGRNASDNNTIYFYTWFLY